MEGLLVLGLLLVLAIQITAWVIVMWDAKRAGITNPHVWGAGLFVPVVGLFVIVAYLYERKHSG